MKNNLNIFDKYAEDYNKLLSNQTWFFSANEQYFASYKINILKNQIYQPVESILDYGCGIGRNIKYLKNSFPNSKIIGTDISSASLEIARLNNDNDIKFFQENDYDNLTYDLILVSGVFHHIDITERQSVANKLFKKLKPNGVIFIFEHNPYNFVTRRIVANCPYDEGVTLIRANELINILQKASFANITHQYTLFIPPFIKPLVKFEKYLGWLPLGGQYWIKGERIG
jgi:SAM-dependent methyltransferase